GVHALQAAGVPALGGLVRIAGQLLHLVLRLLHFALQLRQLRQRLVTPLLGDVDHLANGVELACHQRPPSWAACWGRAWRRALGSSWRMSDMRRRPSARPAGSCMPCCKKACSAGYSSIARSVSGSLPAT